MALSSFYWVGSLVGLYSETGGELKRHLGAATFVRDIRARRASPHSWTARALLHETSNWSPSPHAKSSGGSPRAPWPKYAKAMVHKRRAGRSEAPTWTQ
jgi:hypothetical protein